MTQEGKPIRRLTSSNTQLLRINRGLLFATWFMAIVTAIGVLWGQCNVQEQLNLSKSGLRMQWRPYLDIDILGYSGAMGFTVGESSETDSIVIPIESLSVDSLAYLAVRRFKYTILREMVWHNTGNISLNITHVLPSTLSEEEWTKQYHKSHLELVKAIRRFPEWRPNEIDFLIKPRDSIVRSPGGFGRFMPKQLFETFRLNKKLILYPYTFVEYEDNRGNIYNTLLIHHIILNLRTDSGRVVAEPEVVGVEKYRFDTP